MAVRIGVIGIGVHGLNHVRLLSRMERVDFAGVYDIDAGVSERVAEEFGTVGYGSLDDLLEEVDCVSVAVPTTAHHEVVRHCFRRGRHVLVEKPIAMTASEADAMNSDAEERGLVFAVGHIERFNPAYRSVMENVSSPVFVESHRLSVFNPRGTDVAVVLDLMIHDIDIVLDMVRGPVDSVDAVGVSVVSDEVDIANARIKFESGCVANLTASRISQRRMRKTRIFKRNAYVSIDFLSGESEVFTLNPDTKPYPSPGAVPQLMEGISYRKHPNDGSNALELELADFIAAVERGARPRVTGRDGQRALEIAERVMESMESSMRRIG